MAQRIQLESTQRKGGERRLSIACEFRENALQRHHRLRGVPRKPGHVGQSQQIIDAKLSRFTSKPFGTQSRVGFVVVTMASELPPSAWRNYVVPCVAIFSVTQPRLCFWG